MAARKFIYDANGQVMTSVTVEEDNQMVIQTQQDARPIIEANKNQRDWHKPSGDMKLAGRVPMTVYNKALREGWANDPSAWKKYLNDPDHKAFRVWEGRL